MDYTSDVSSAFFDPSDIIDLDSDSFHVHEPQVIKDTDDEDEPASPSENRGKVDAEIGETMR